MRRIALLGLLIAVGCTPVSAPSVVVAVGITNNASAGGVFVGDTFTVTGVAYDANANPIALFPVTYTSSNTSVATISSTGLVTALTAGTTKVQAQSGGTPSAQMLVTVDGNVTSRIIVTPNTPLMTVGNQLQLTATVYTTINNPARGKSVTWSTADATKVTVDASGNISAIATGPAVLICATSVDTPTVKGCATVTVQ